jgi:plastocyanin domain-containing protein
MNTTDTMPLKSEADRMALIFVLSAAAVVVLLIIGLVVFSLTRSSGKSDEVITTTITNNVMVDADRQIIDLTAKGGFEPKTTVAKANKETILKLNTKNTFDCSSTLSIPALGVSKQLKPNGTEEVVIPAQQPGTKISGTCSMGMYSFSLNFIQ